MAGRERVGLRGSLRADFEVSRTHPHPTGICRQLEYGFEYHHLGIMRGKYQKSYSSKNIPRHRKRSKIVLDWLLLQALQAPNAQNEL